MDDLIAEFLTETNESLQELDMDLVNLEQNPNDQELLGKIFRLMHTIKGTCGFLDLPKLEKVAHHAENVLGRFRDGDLEVSGDSVTLIFESIDVIKSIVVTIEETGSEGDRDDSDLIRRLDEIFEGKADGADSGVQEAKEDAPEDVPAVAAVEIAPDIDQYTGEPIDFTPVPAGQTGDANPLDPTKNKDAQEDAKEPEAIDTVQDAEAQPEPEAAPPAPAPAAATPAAQDSAPAQAKAPVQTVESLRVNVDVLENLMTMVSELVLTRNQLLQIMRTQQNSDFSTPLQRLNHVVSELQEGVMKTRMQPIGNAWAKLPRIIRDLALELNKKLDLEMIGKDTELDRQVLDLIKDPLTHMVRNSGDHGIELPADRVAAGKSETGKIVLRAYHEGGHIIIEIEDDGKGLPMDKIKEKIVKNGLATEGELAEMTTQQIQQFIFKAGLSTAEKVTSVSGRGVGMDVVRTNIEKIGGSIELKSIEGQGSTFTIKIPLTLAIVSALIVEAGGERFAIPQLSVQELVMASHNGKSQIEMIKGTPVYRLRDHLLPLVSLNDMLKLSPLHDEEQLISDMPEKAHNAPADAQGEDGSDSADAAAQMLAEMEARPNNQYIVVTNVGTYSFGIIVDRVFDTEEIVVKPVAGILRDIDLFSGNTILGDGSVIMILDPNGIARASGEMDTGKAGGKAKEDVPASSTSSEKTSLLLFSAGDKAPKAVPLSLVARLENIEVADIEYSNGQMLTQYRGALMPLVPFNSSVSIEDQKDKPVLVFASDEQSLGIIVDEIIDIVEEHIDVQVAASQSGVLGSAIINKHATDIVDVAHYLGMSGKDWFKDHGDEAFESSVSKRGSKSTVLLVDDSPFFRNMLTPLLSVAGYDVTTLESPMAALQMCEDGAQFDVIISDIEMPDMNGYEFAQKVKDGSFWKDTPMVALTSHATDDDINRGKEVGFEKYIAKFDRDTLLSTLSETLEARKSA